MWSVARVLASNESPFDPNCKEIFERKMMADRNGRAMVELLRSGISGNELSIFNRCIDQSSRHQA
jgi:hypothetical protein